MQQTVYTDQNVTNVEETMEHAREAFDRYKSIPATERACFLEAIAGEIEKSREQLVEIANGETNLPAARLNGEITRTTNQLKLFANLVREGSWVDACIDTADATRVPKKPDIRRMLVPMGPVVVFGASNFPFAFSTAGGDTASALASGSAVVIKAHSAHAQTSEMVFSAMRAAIRLTAMPEHTVQHVLGSGSTVGKALVMHPHTRAVGFTGSFSGGRALLDYSNQRESPIPVFAEMSSINPVVFYPDALKENGAALAAQYAASITLGIGQFCTNPGLLLGLAGEAFTTFLQALGQEMAKVQPQKMLHQGIWTSYQKGIDEMLGLQGLDVIAGSTASANEGEGAPMLASVRGSDFLKHAGFAEEVFGPWSLAVICEDKDQLKKCLQHLKGQLTSTIIATDKDLADYGELTDLQRTLAGRILLNDVPTGVEVCPAMVHGGPWPATTDARFTSVGTAAIKRWARPLCLQNFTELLLPDELKDANPLGIFRLVNNIYTRDAVGQRSQGNHL